MADFADQSVVLELFKEAQKVETDNRSRASDAHSFIDDKDGQWESNFTKDDNKPRYTFDIVSSIVEQIAGEMEQADFGIKVNPAGGEATKDFAMMRNGLIRNIQNISNAKDIFNAAGRGMVTSGLDGWLVATRFIDSDSFDQDLVIDPILDFGNRVWFDPNARRQDKSDAKYCFVIQPIGKDEYKKRFPQGSEQSISGNSGSICDTSSNNDWGYKPDDIFIGQIYYKKEVMRELVQLSDGQVLENDDDFKQIKDELADQGIVVTDTRKRPKTVVFSRLFDANAWLIDEEKTVFSWIPVVPTYGNYKINNNKTKYRGVVEKLMDPQRVMNYSLSREIEEGALAPRAKIWMTTKQAAGYESTLQTMNTNSDPVQLFNPDSEVPGIPGTTGGATVNPGLRTISLAMKDMIGFSAGLFAANMGDNPGLQSGVAIEALQNKGDTGTISYFKSQEIAICHTARIINDAADKVYDTKRQVRIVEEDGTSDMVTLNDQILDNETQEMVTINDLSKGKYDVVCKAGPSFQNRQQEAVSGIIEAAQVDPSIMQIGSDIMLNNMTFPGAEKIGERKRAQLFDAGLIPIDQMTDDEKQEMLAAQEAREAQGDQPSPEMLIGQAELITAQNEQDKTQVSVKKIESDLLISANRERREDAKFQESVRSGRASFNQSVEENQFSQVMAVQQQTLDSLKTMADTLKTIQEAAQGPVVGPGFVENVKDGSELVSEAQDAVGQSSLNGR